MDFSPVRSKNALPRVQIGLASEELDALRLSWRGHGMFHFLTFAREQPDNLSSESVRVVSSILAEATEAGVPGPVGERRRCFEATLGQISMLHTSLDITVESI